MLKILVVDDDKLIRWSLKELFSQEGYLVTVSASAGEAIKQAESIPYDLVIADIEINDESGFEMLRKIRSAQPDAQVIILSALSRQQIESQVVDLHVFSIIEKPFNSEHISSVTKQALNKEAMKMKARKRRENKKC